jgi:hypothetical protein
MKLPDEIVLGGVTLRRVRENGRPTGWWEDDAHWNTLQRNKGRWLFAGSPTNNARDHDEWRDTPHEAYLANLQVQRAAAVEVVTMFDVLIRSEYKRAV